MKYTVNYFIYKFEKIPENKWCTGNYGSKYDEKHCVFGHCNIMASHDATNEATDLESVFFLGGISDIVGINDGFNDYYNQPTPKQRILAALYDIKKLQQPQEKIKTVYVAVPVSITEDIEIILS